MAVDGGKTWITAPSTPHGHTDIAGLTPMETYSFRVSVTAEDREDAIANPPPAPLALDDVLEDGGLGIFGE